MDRSPGEIARRTGARLPALADPAHPGALLIRHVGVAVALLLAGMIGLVLLLGSTVRLTISVQAQGLLESGAGARCDRPAHALVMPESDARGAGGWCAQLWVDSAVRGRLQDGAPVTLRIPPQGRALRGRIAGFAEEADGAAGSGERRASVHRIFVLPRAEPGDAAETALAQDGGARPVTAEIFTGSVSAGEYLVESVTGWLRRRDP